MARDAGAVTINYGVFLNAVVSFVIVGFAIFLMVRSMNRLEAKLEAQFSKEKPKPGEPTDKKCPYCLTTVPFQAVRCSACTSQLEAASKV
jgi:large conductance mechanosensitive channel